MSDIEMAQQGIEQAAQAHQEHGQPSARKVALLIAVLAAALAIAEMGAKSAQSEYLTQHISVSDDWNFYQAKKGRATTLAAAASILDRLPGAAADTITQEQIVAMRKQTSKLESDPVGGEGTKQLMQKALDSTLLRNAAFHRYHFFEVAVGFLQIAIVLASASVVTRMGKFAIGAGVLGAGAAMLGLLTVAGLV